jgi:tRNA threonylcarbamoyladenosine biosynthesis protein TsaB
MPLRILAIDAGTEVLSVALGTQHGAMAVAAEDAAWDLQVFEGAGGAQASSTLIPAVRRLLDQAGVALDALDALAFGAGPGSFTGLRTACAVAQGLAFGARRGQGLPVLPVDSLMAVAEDARAQLLAQQRIAPPTPAAPLDMLAVLDARMDEVYAARLRHQGAGWQAEGDFWLGAPQDLALPPGAWLVGNALAVHPTRLPRTALHCAARPSAVAMLRLAPQLLAQGRALDPAQALPRYVRDKVALTTAERQARAAARAVSTGAGSGCGGSQ